MPVTKHEGGFDIMYVRDSEDIHSPLTSYMHLPSEKAIKL